MMVVLSSYPELLDHSIMLFLQCRVFHCRLKAKYLELMDICWITDVVSCQILLQVHVMVRWLLCSEATCGDNVLNNSMLDS
jgi:hypothetical protein